MNAYKPRDISQTKGYLINQRGYLTHNGGSFHTLEGYLTSQKGMSHTQGSSYKPEGYVLHKREGVPTIQRIYLTNQRGISYTQGREFL